MPVRPSGHSTGCHAMSDKRREFSFAEPCLWNSLPVTLRDRDISLVQFKRPLKSLLFVQGCSAQWLLLYCAVYKYSYLLTYLQQITYKMASLTFDVSSSSTPGYPSDLIQTAVLLHPLRSSDARLLTAPEHGPTSQQQLQQPGTPTFALAYSTDIQTTLQNLLVETVLTKGHQPLCILGLVVRYDTIIVLLSSTPTVAAGVWFSAAFVCLCVCLFVCLFFRTISQKSLQRTSPNLGAKGQGHEAQNIAAVGFCLLLVISIMSINYTFGQLDAG